MENQKSEDNNPLLNNNCIRSNDCIAIAKRKKLFNIYLALSILYVATFSTALYFEGGTKLLFEGLAYLLPCLAAMLAGGGIYFKEYETEYFQLSAVTLLLGTLSFGVTFVDRHPLIPVWLLNIPMLALLIALFYMTYVTPRKKLAYFLFSIAAAFAIIYGYLTHWAIVLSRTM